MQSTTEDILSEVIRRLVEEFDPEKIILFGSRAWGNPGPDSDYDLFVIVNESREHAIRRARRSSMSKTPADIDGCFNQDKIGSR